MSTPIFNRVEYKISSLVEEIKTGDIAVPDIQRHYEWGNKQVLALCDSMYNGYPLGSVLLWEPFERVTDKEKIRHIGTNEKIRYPRLLIVDGQQRLTTLTSIMTGSAVIKKGEIDPVKIEIGFNPISEEFAISDEKIKNNPLFFSNITDIFLAGYQLHPLFNKYVEGLKSVVDLSEEDQNNIFNNLYKIAQLANYPLSALELDRTVDAEKVSDIFVRVNSSGKSLSEVDFVLTLLSVFWSDGRRRFETFSHDNKNPLSTKGGASPFNDVIQFEPNDILRIVVGYGFNKAIMKSIYNILRGRDTKTGNFDLNARDEHFNIMKDSTDHVLDLNNFHEFVNCVMSTGYKSKNMISSSNVSVMAYILYLKGKISYKMSSAELRTYISKWFYMSSLTARYSGTAEGKMEQDLSKFKDCKSSTDFISVIDEICETTLTKDYFSINLPSLLEKSTTSKNPQLNAYYAALIRNDAKILYSDLKVEDLLYTSRKSKRKQVEIHHLFPKSYLEDIGYENKSIRNQISNYAYIEWTENLNIGKKSPKEYVPILEKRFSSSELERFYYFHALPDNWYDMDYINFISLRRKFISKVISDNYYAIFENKESNLNFYADVDNPVDGGESDNIEYKSTLSKNLYTNEKDTKMELACLKTIAAFLNSPRGGKLYIGVKDDGTPLGIDADVFENKDKLSLHLNNLITTKIGKEYTMYIQPEFVTINEKEVLMIKCLPSRSPVYVKDGDNRRFYLRGVSATNELQGKEIVDFVKDRFS